MARIRDKFKDVCESGKKLSQTILRGRLPAEYGDGKTTAAYLAVLFADAAEVAIGDFVDDLVESWARRRVVEIADAAKKEAKARQKPAADIIAEMQEGMADVGSATAESETVRLSQVVAQVVRQTAECYQDRTIVPGYDTGLPTLDSMLRPLRNGRVYFLGGDQKSGKTALAMQILSYNAERGVNVFMAQGEMSANDIGARALAGESRIDANQIDIGDINPGEFDIITEASRAPWMDRFFFWRFKHTRISQFRNRCRMEKRRNGIQLIMADHLLHIDPDKEFDNEFRGIAKVVYGLKDLAEELDLPIICMTHRTRASQDRQDPTPLPTDFYGGGVIERACDALFAVYSKSRWLALRKPTDRGENAVSKWEQMVEAARGKAQIALLAHRHAPFPRIEEFGWNGALTRRRRARPGRIS